MKAHIHVAFVLEFGHFKFSRKTHFLREKVRRHRCFWQCQNFDVKIAWLFLPRKILASVRPIYFFKKICTQTVQKNTVSMEMGGLRYYQKQ